MSLIYHKEAWQRFGPPPIVVRDARGRVLRHVVACDPLTGEVISLAAFWGLLLVGGSILPTGPSGIGMMLAHLWLRFDVSLPFAETGKAHWFAPAPLTITRQET